MGFSELSFHQASTSSFGFFLSFFFSLFFKWGWRQQWALWVWVDGAWGQAPIIKKGLGLYYGVAGLLSLSPCEEDRGKGD